LEISRLGAAGEFAYQALGKEQDRNHSPLCRFSETSPAPPRPRIPQ